MSHVTSVKVKVRDLTALKQAVQRMGGIFVQDQKTYSWWGQSVGDTPLPEGFTLEMLGKCQHAIRVPGGNYEIGVVKMPAGHYELAYDSYNCGMGPNGIPADGEKLHQKFGTGLKGLIQMYGVVAATLKAKAQGWVVSETKLSNGSIRLQMTGMR